MIIVSEDIFNNMFSEALNVRKNSCSEHSGFAVGASIIDDKGRIFTGCNVESSSYGLSVCAERNALFSALCSGSRDLKAILITADSEGPVSPCGACRQLLYDYAPDITVIMTNIKGDTLTAGIGELLKYPFGFKK